MGSGKGKNRRAASVATPAQEETSNESTKRASFLATVEAHKELYKTEGPASKAYLEATQQAADARKQAKKTAWDAADKVVEEAYEALKKAEAEADEEYDLAAAPAKAIYDQTMAPAKKVFNEAMEGTNNAKAKWAETLMSGVDEREYEPPKIQRN